MILETVWNLVFEPHKNRHIGENIRLLDVIS